MTQELSTTTPVKAHLADLRQEKFPAVPQTLNADEVKLIAGGPTIDNDPKP